MRATHQTLSAIIDSHSRDELGVELALAVKAEERCFANVRITEKKKFQQIVVVEMSILVHFEWISDRDSLKQPRNPDIKKQL